ncbi:MAG: HIT family protein [Arcobacteraceae bacterium]|nr:HIT family protein [Arcobacteraceae bacterium]
MQDLIYENNLIYIEIHPSTIPWLKVFDKLGRKEFSDCDNDTKLEILRVLDIIEKELIKEFNPDKINIASFGNYLPKVHFHIMARFKDDDYFPESMWGVKQRENQLKLDSIKVKNFYIKLSNIL